VADPDFIESTSEGEPFSSSDEADAELLERVLESAYSSKPGLLHWIPPKETLCFFLTKT